MNELSGALPTNLMWDDKQLPSAKGTLGKDDFMKLLLTQMQNQDPMNPMEHEQFAAQLAQFGSLEKLTNIERGIQDVSTGFNKEAKLQALGMIGKRIKAVGNAIDLKEGNGVSIPISLKSESRPLKATIFDTNGRLVRTIDLSQKARESAREITWDGKNEQGETLPTGKYTFRVLGVGKDGRAEESGSDIRGKVAGVEVNGLVPTLIVETPSGTQRVGVTKVVSVSLDSSSPKPQGHKSVGITTDQEQSDESDWDVDSRDRMERGFRPLSIQRPIGGRGR